jgi:putative transposase
MNSAPKPKSFIRKTLSHKTHFAGRFGATYFITICCRERHRNQLCHEHISHSIFATAALYDEKHLWYLKLILLMPDHLHALIAVDGHTSLGRVIGNFKRATTRFAGVEWQRNFFDHRLRSDESLTEKATYIRQNPVRAALVKDETNWPYVLDRTSIADGGSVSRHYLSARQRND